MAQQQSDRVRWLKIARIDTLGKILDCSDPEPTPTLYDPDEEGTRSPKFALNYVEYDPQTTKSTIQHRHWVDEADLYVLATDLLHGRRGDKDAEGRYRPIHQEFKGGSARAAGIDSLGEDGLVSRQFSVTFTDQLTKVGPAFELRFTVLPGEKGGKGQITPVRGAKPLLDIKPMYVALPFARKFGGQILNHLQAKRTAALVGKYYVDPLWARLGQGSDR